ncbi:MAG: NAD-dependent epimerase/dehydratase family protein [Chloroflexi bacterium]|nr:MAG: NAD-dependent epimerase/dehydratase family protein [Chloroflexota bacterium]
MILVTGATGFIGRSLMNRLQIAGYTARPFTGRITDTAAIREQLADIHTVIHLAGAEARGRHRLLQRVDVEGTRRLLDECRRAGVQHIIIPSRLGADPNASQMLLRVKGQVERLVRQSGIPYTILRTTTLYGRNDRFTEIILSLALWSWPFVWLPGGGKVPFQPLWVEDYTRCLVATLKRPDLQNKTISLGGEERLKYREIVVQILQAADIRRILLPLPMVLLRPLSTLLFRWWYWPPVTPYFVERFFVPDLAELDSVLHHFYFRPVRLPHNLAYLRRPGLRRRLFRRY